MIAFRVLAGMFLLRMLQIVNLQHIRASSVNAEGKNMAAVATHKKTAAGNKYSRNQ